MTSRGKVLLAVLSIMVTTCQYIGLKLEDFIESSWEVDPSTVQPKSFENNTTNFSSSAPPLLEIGQLQGSGVVKVNRNNDDRKSSDTKLLYQKTKPPTTAVGHDGNTSKFIQAEWKSGTARKSPECCLRPSINVTTRLTPRFFEIQRTNGIDPKTNWSGTEYEEWVAISARLNPNHENYTNLDCTTQYTLLVMEQVSGFYLRCVLTELGPDGIVDNFPFYEEKHGLPRILLLGDSISKEIRNQTQLHHHEQANIQGGPTNGLGFSRYKAGLREWLGHCPWDLVQFNVGMHFRPKRPEDYPSWQNDYREGITYIVNEIRNHSPSAHIVFALTTPSPFDSNATTPNNATCPYYNKFHKAGFVPAMNNVANSVAKEHGVIINDRYSFILPVLEKYQFECDVHYTEEGSQVMSERDWKLFSELLSIKNIM